MSTNFHHNSGRPVGPQTSHSIVRDSLSTNPKAVYTRNYRLTLSEEKAENQKSLAKARAGKKKQAAIRLRSEISAKNKSNSKNKEASIRRHLSKGRSVADIAIREFMMVSIVQQIVDRILQSEGSQQNNGGKKA